MVYISSYPLFFFPPNEYFKRNYHYPTNKRKNKNEFIRILVPLPFILPYLTLLNYLYNVFINLNLNLKHLSIHIQYHGHRITIKYAFLTKMMGGIGQ